jgi:hypothetical protein
MEDENDLHTECMYDNEMPSMEDVNFDKNVCDESWRWCDVEVMDNVEIMGESAKSPLLNDSSALYVIQMPKLNAISTLTTSTPIISYRMKSCKPEQKE